MAPKRKAGAKATKAGAKATKAGAKATAAASSDTVGIPELFKKVKADLQPDAKLAPQIQEKAALEPASVARSAADGAGGSDDAASAAAAARAPTVPPAAAAAPPQVPLTAAEDELLRDFDLDIAFGPSLGLTRKERWQRAQGAPPPAPLPPPPARPAPYTRAASALLCPLLRLPCRRLLLHCPPRLNRLRRFYRPRCCFHLRRHLHLHLLACTATSTSTATPDAKPVALPAVRLRLGPTGAGDGGALQGSSGHTGRPQRLLALRRLCHRRLAALWPRGVDSALGRLAAYCSSV